VKLSLILVPVKDLPLDEEVLHLAFSLVAPVGDRRNKQRARIEIIHVIEVPQALPLDAELPEAVQHGEVVLAQAEQLARQRDVEVSAEMLQARSAGVAIVDEAVERGPTSLSWVPGRVASTVNIIWAIPCRMCSRMRPAGCWSIAPHEQSRSLSRKTSDGRHRPGRPCGGAFLLPPVRQKECGHS
jgi:hypothetical protein